MYGKQEQIMLFTTPEAQENQIPAWKELDEVIRKWAVLSGFEKDQEKYAKLAEISKSQRPRYQD